MNYPDREAFYWRRRMSAENVAISNRQRALENKELCGCWRKMRFYSLHIGRALADGELERSEKYQKNYEELKGKIKSILQTLGLTVEDFQPKYVCAKCSDSGFTKEGMLCDCFNYRW